MAMMKNAFTTPGMVYEDGSYEPAVPGMNLLEWLIGRLASGNMDYYAKRSAETEFTAASLMVRDAKAIIFAIEGVDSR